MATIFTLVIDNDTGTTTEVFYTSESRDLRCEAIITAAWAERGINSMPQPANWRDALDELDNRGWDNWLVLAEHELDPAILLKATALRDKMQWMADEASEMLAKPGFRPSRGHLENARNLLRQAVAILGGPK